MTVTRKSDSFHNKHCYHCGEICNGTIAEAGKYFCCNGCHQVYLLLEENNLCNYYDLDAQPGIKAKGNFTNGRFAYLDDPEIFQQLVQFADDKLVNVTFTLPSLHCSSCVYLVENLHRINPGILVSRTDFQRKEVFLSFDPSLISLRELVELLAFIGYEPSLNLKDVGTSTTAGIDPAARSFKRRQVYKIGIAGFCFGNIMMLSFPDYFAGGNMHEKDLKLVFTWLSFVLSVPVLLFCSSGIFKAAWAGIRQRYINIDLPIALAIIMTFARSYYEIITGTGSGYLDSGSGIIFFMLVGRWFQDKTYAALTFDRDYKSYLPLGVTKLDGTKEKSVSLNTLHPGDRILVRNEELIPADAVLISASATIDYSFITGENNPVQKNAGDIIHAGSKQLGQAIELKVIKSVSQSYITELWNNDRFTDKHQDESFIHPWSRYFTLALLSIALCTIIFWLIKNPDNILPAATAVLIVACPCSLLLSATFTYGNMLRIFGKNKLFLKNAQVIESMAKIDTIAFDKTGTLTTPNASLVYYNGSSLTDHENSMLIALSNQSTHPLSKMITAHLGTLVHAPVVVKQYREFPGLGIQASIDHTIVRIGAAGFMAAGSHGLSMDVSSQVYVKIGHQVKGSFSIQNEYREGVKEMINALNKNEYALQLVSGDNNSELLNLQALFGERTALKFAQTPLQKLDYIRQLQSGYKKVLMIGDGLNDAGALQQADVGIAINNDDAHFTPACDAILSGEEVNKLHRFLRFAKCGKRIVMASFILSIVYNIVGLSFAVTANLSPLVAAILMPASSISIVLFVTLASSVVAKRLGLS